MIAYIFQRYPENFTFQLCNFAVNYREICQKLAYFLTVSIAFSVYKQNFAAQ